VSAALDIVLFAAGAIVSLRASWILVSRIERLGERYELSEALLGVVAALAADSPEITAATTALVRHQQHVGAGVIVGSNVFNIASLLGLGALVAGRIALHRRVVVFAGAVALWTAAVCLAVVEGAIGPATGLALTAIVLAGYVVLVGWGPALLRSRRVPLPERADAWLLAAVAEEEQEMEGAVLPAHGHRRDAAVAAVCLLVVVGASILMESAAVSLGHRWGLSDLVVGALILGAVTSLPNAVAGTYLSRRGRGAATFSTALNSNNLNIVVGLLLPGAIVGLDSTSGGATAAVGIYAAMTALALAFAYARSGIGRVAGATLIGGFVVFAGLVVGGALG
jgi:cation:H+ antiporter